MKDFEQLVNQLSSEATSVPPAPPPWLLSLKWSGFAIAYLFAALFTSGLRPDLSQALQHPLYVAELLLLGLILLSSTLAASLLAFPDLHQKRRLAYIPAALFGIFVMLLAFAWLAETPPAPSPVHSFECTLDITLISLIPAALALTVMRRYASTHPGWAGSLSLCAAFSVGALWLRLYEVNDSTLHVVMWHYLPMVVVALAGWGLGARLLKW